LTPSRRSAQRRAQGSRARSSLPVRPRSFVVARGPCVSSEAPTTRPDRKERLMFDQKIIGQMTAELMEEAEQQYGPDAEIRLAAMIVAVEHGEQTTYHWRFRPPGNLPH